MKNVYIIGLLFMMTGCSDRVTMSGDGKAPEPAAQNNGKAFNISGEYNGTSVVYSPKEDEEYVVEVKYDKKIVVNGLNTGSLSHPAERSNEAIRLYNKCQYQIYHKNYDSAIYFINKSIEQVESSEALALKGSILYLKGLTLDARQYWDRAVKMDSTIVLPSIH